MRRAVLFAALIFVIAPPVAPAPKAEPTECRGFWDVALVARAHALAKIDRESSLAAMRHIYDFSADPRHVEIAAAIVDAAQRGERERAADFARRLYVACMTRNGDMDSVLGVRL